MLVDELPSGDLVHAIALVLLQSSASASKIGAPIPLAQLPTAITLRRFMGDERRRKKLHALQLNWGPP
jgi:hypothetical protein